MSASIPVLLSVPELDADSLEEFVAEESAVRMGLTVVVSVREVCSARNFLAFERSSFFSSFWTTKRCQFPSAEMVQDSVAHLLCVCVFLLRNVQIVLAIYDNEVATKRRLPLWLLSLPSAKKKIYQNHVVHA